MATYRDLTRGHGHDEALEAIDAQIPGLSLNDEAEKELLALLLLDEHYGLVQEEDYLYLTPGFMWAIMPFEILEPTVAKLFSVTETTPSEAELEAATERATREPFEIRLKYNSEAYAAAGVEAPSEEAIPEKLRGKTIRVRLMTGRDAERCDAMMTRRANGDVIELPSTDSESRPLD